MSTPITPDQIKRHTQQYPVEASGGCQCGAVRYHVTAMMDNAHVCHCRMCQKAVGGPFASLAAAPRAALTWTRGTPAVFHSSAQVARGFCRDCGTPLFYDYLGGKTVNLTPYLGYQALFIVARSGVLDVTPTTDEYLNPSGRLSEFVFKDAGVIMRHRPFIGLRFIFSVIRVTFEAMIVPGGGRAVYGGA